MKTTRGTWMSIAAFAIMGMFTAEMAYTQNGYYCSSAATCKDFNSNCAMNGTCTTKDTTSAVGCLFGSGPCAVLDIGTTCPGACSTGGKCDFIVYTCGNPK